MAATAKGLINQFLELYRASPPYVWGGSSLDGMDCSGAFVWAYKRLGLPSIAHGSNTIARSYVVELLPIIHAEPGMAAFKAREPGQKGYALPGKFQQGGKSYNGDLRDYYHIGLVDETGRYVYNAQSTSTGFVRSKTTAGWSWCAKLKAVDYQTGDENIMTSKVVTAENGGRVMVRCTPSTNGRIAARLRCGTVVQAGDDLEGWTPIKYDDIQGYMMSDFLVPLNESVATPTDLPSAGPANGDGQVIIQLPYNVARSVLEALVRVLGVG